MLIEVLHVVNGTTHTHKFTCTNAARQLGVDGVNITFRDGTGRDHIGRKVLSAQYRTGEVMITYDENEIL
jgi:hypothetical protein